MQSARRRIAAGRRIAAVSLAILAHAALFSLLVSAGGRLPFQSSWQVRPTEVWLAPPLVLRRPPAERLRLPARHRALRAAPASGSPALAQSPPNAPTVVAPWPSAPGVGAALRKWVGCANPDSRWMSEADRAACAERLAENRPTAPTLLNLDPHGRYVSNPEPYLTRMPKNGCKVRAAGDAGPMGQQGVAAGVSCAVSF